LIFVSAGNVDVQRPDDFPARNETEQIHDPSQAWNAVSVGGFTDKAILSDRAYAAWQPLAPRGGLSPASSTSLTWDHDWPLKPDLVLEAGNRIVQAGTGAVDRHGDVELLTTNANWRSRLLTTTGDTSAATVEAARYAALIQAEYPRLWPETVRALLVHSARCTPQMLDRRPPEKIAKSEWRRILRTYGFGVPDLAAALRSARSAVTLVCQDELQPFILDGVLVKTNELRFHNLPWPRQALQPLGAAPVEMRVTLSYFIEPNPGPRLPTNRYRYGSCSLRFDVRRSTESEAEFRARINAEARTEDEDGSGTESDSAEWLLGAKLRHRGSLHSDVWLGTAADLAQKHHIAVFPLNGWWRLRKHLGQYNRRLRYALIVSIKTSAIGVDLYTPIETEIRTLVPVANR
jgi:Subtilase family